ncbi:hypothetical protein Asi03nite_09340 [Actinoplanes siamensis]|uniref:DNA-binding protein n=2 Tax=Actinoplanes siamensis TaxID=1223317 RepID=A0A919K9A4_9ACTN|nr:hypothetical protein Asi03nite_09340 [Actinoplanes siamensis]
MAAGEIAKRLGLSRQRVQQLAERDDWPEPFDELSMGRVWLISDIETWIRHQRADRVRPAEPPPTAGPALTTEPPPHPPSTANPPPAGST